MPMEKKSGESKNDFISRCISHYVGKGREQQQAIAICESEWTNMEAVLKKIGIIEDFKKMKKKKASCSECEEEKLKDYPWDQCIQDQIDAGYDEETAKKICGAIRAKNMSKEEAIKSVLENKE